MAQLLQDWHIDSDYALGNVIKNLFPNIKGHSVFLYKEGSQITSAEEAVLAQFPDKTSRREITDYILSSGYSHQSAYQIITTVLQNKIYVATDTEELYRRDCFNIDDEVLDNSAALPRKCFWE